MLRRSRARKQERAEAAADVRGNVLEDLAKIKGKKAKLHRPAIPDGAMLEASLIQGILCACGCGEIGHKGNMQKEHNPALELRAFDPQTKKYTPDANDPRYLRWMITSHHDKKTHGPGGEKRITTKGGDNHARQHNDNLSKSERDFHDRMAKKGKPMVPRRI